MSSPHSQQADPLLPPKLANEQQAPPLSSTSSGAIKAVSVVRIGLGAACLIAPRWTCALFKFPIPAAYTILPRLFGIRDLVIGELLITAEDKTATDGGRREIKRALWANIGTDCVDIASIAFGLANGTVGRTPALLLAGAATAFVGLEALGMRGL